MALRAAGFALRTARNPALEVTLTLDLSSVSFPLQKAALVAAVAEVVLLELLLLPQAAIPSPARHSAMTAGTTRRFDHSRLSSLRPGRATSRG
jgi:hypothetical protein